MSEINNDTVIGSFTVRPTEYADGEQLDRLKRYDTALGHAGHDRLHFQPAGLYQIDLYVLTSAGADTTKSSCRFSVPYPLQVWAADVGCESAGGATGTVDIFTDDGTTDASILNAAEDVKTAAGVSSRVAPEVGKDELAYNTEVYIKQASGGGGTMVGGQAHLYVQRL